MCWMMRLKEFTRLRRGAAVNIDHGCVLAAARHVVGHVDESGDGPFAVSAGIVHQKRLDHVVRPHAATREWVICCDFAIAEGIHPDIVGDVGPLW